MEVCEDIDNVSTLSWGESGLIFKFKRAPKQVNTNFTDFRLLFIVYEIFAFRNFQNEMIEIFNGCPLRC